MILTICVFISVVILLILTILFKPSINIKGHKIDIFYIAPLIGALILIAFKKVPVNEIIKAFTSDSNVNPIKILILFMSISILSISLDELGFFKMLASKAIKKCKNNQFSLFFTLYFLISVLTIFTSNDIVILTFTPFICYFAKNAKINPIPFLIMEFVNANTYSMLLSIGNPTNIYLSQFFDISFIYYLKIMILPTLFSGIISLLILLALFYKELKKPMQAININTYEIKHNALVIINLISLIITTVLLVISNYINIQMWIICFISACSLTLVLFVYEVIYKKDKILFNVYKRLPYSLIPFVLSMFIIVLSLEYSGITIEFANFLSNLSYSKETTSLTYLIASTLADNFINNIPMSVLFSSILSNVNQYREIAIYSTIVGSNVGAYLTPIGALAGIMWISLLKKYEVKFEFISFVTYGIIVVPFVILAAFIGLIIVLWV